MKRNQKENSFFIGGNFIDSQLIYTIPFVISFCQEKKIKNLIVERAISDAILKHPYIKKIILTVNIIIVKNKPLFFEIILCFLPALYFFFKFKKKKSITRK